MIHDFTQGNSDNLVKAVEGLDQFCKNWCMNCAETKRANEPIFRCDECVFGNSENGVCILKKFVSEHRVELKKKGYDYFNSFGCMSR